MKIIAKKTNWQTKKLGEVCDIKTGRRDANHGNPKGKYHFFTCAKEHTYIDDYNFDCEAILIAGNGDVGETKYFKGKFDAYQRTYVLHNFSEKIKVDLLFYLLNGFLKDTVSKQKLGGTMPYIKLGMLRNFEISFPKSLSEQKRIVKILDGVFKSVEKAKENAEKNLANAKELFESYLQSVFENPGEDWEEKKLGEIVKLEYGKPLPKLKRKTNGEYPVYGANGIKSRSDAFYFDKPSIIVGRKGSAGELNLTENKFWPLDVSYFVTFNDKKYNLKFLYNLLFTLNLPKLAKGVKPGINRNEVYNIDVRFPDIKTQKQIVKKLDELSAQTKKLEDVYRQKIDDLEELKKSVLKKAFDGEL